ncbi:MAG: 5-bromo-4-chloroindolyl phosphate hydrolysis family protein [Oscillospiraceae bacterium]|nr:5-bromo-4-chloroindolyl phosphate hydrolysis family protein [Oscillospiraceae bacterium]
MNNNNNNNNNNQNYNKNARTTDFVFGVSCFVASVVVVPGLFLVLSIIYTAITEDGGVFFLTGFYGIIFSIFWIITGIKALLRAERAKKYTKVFGAYPRVKMSEVIKKTGNSLKVVSADLNVMKKRGYWHDINFDLANKEIVFSRFLADSEPLPQVGNESLTMYEERKSFPLYAIAACVVTALCFSFWWGLSLIIGIGGFFLWKHFFPAPVYFVEVDRKASKLKRPGATGNETLDEMLNSVFKNKKELLRISQSIVSPKVRSSLGEILRVLDQITEYVTKNPEKVKNLRQFTGYYLPTTVNFLQTYEELEQKPDKGENINAALLKIEETTADMTSVFKQEYDNLFSDRVMDISAEAAVMQTIISENSNKI